LETITITTRAILTTLLAQSRPDSVAESDKAALILRFLIQNSIVGWIIGGFSVLTLTIAAITTLTGNLDKILEFFRKYFTSEVTELSERQLHNLRCDLLKIEQAIVNQRLKDSLHNLVKIDLDKEEQRQRVGRPPIRLGKEDPEPAKPLRNLINRSLEIFKKPTGIVNIPSANQTSEIFHRKDIQGRLLILGEPGAGKTTELLILAEALIEAAIESKDRPIPIICELSNWKPEIPIFVWLEAHLYKKYKVSKNVAAQWIQSNQLLPLLDGLDELGLENQVAAIDAINDCLAEKPVLSLVVCCRREEYEKGGHKITQLKGAIYLQPVTTDQIQQYLRALNRRSLWNNIQAQPEMLELAKSPLFLTMLVVAYEGHSIHDQKDLFEAYIEKQLNDTTNRGAYSTGKAINQKKTRHHLIWLAKQLEGSHETEFLIEGMQPSCLSSEKQKLFYEILLAINLGLLVGLLMGGSLGLASGLAFALPYWLSEEASTSNWDGLRIGLQTGLTVGLAVTVAFTVWSWLIFGLGVGLGLGLFFAFCFGLFGGFQTGLLLGMLFGLLSVVVANPKQAVIFKLPLWGRKKASNHDIIEPAEKFKWSLQSGLKAGLIGALKNGPWAGLLFGLFGSLADGLMGGLGVGLVGALINGLKGGLSTNRVQEKKTPNQGIWKSAQIFFVGMLTLGLGGMLASVLFGMLLVLISRTVGYRPMSSGLEEYVALGVPLGIFIWVEAILLGLLGEPIKGIKAVVQHFTLRIILTAYGYSPWNYARFLDYAARHRFVQRTGGRYRFVHDLLQKHFAQMSID
jgi:NACHT domain